MKYSVSFSSTAGKEFEDLDKAIQEQILKKLEKLEDNPELGECLSNMLKHRRRLHIGDYRVIYSIHGEQIVIGRVSHRKHVYE